MSNYGIFQVIIGDNYRHKLLQETKEHFRFIYKINNDVFKFMLIYDKNNTFEEIFERISPGDKITLLERYLFIKYFPLEK